MSERISGHELLASRCVVQLPRTQEAALVLCWLKIRAAITPADGPGQGAGQRAWKTEQVDPGAGSLALRASALRQGHIVGDHACSLG